MNQKKMRKFSSFMAAAVAMLAAVSCNKEINNIDPVTPGADAVVYTAYVDGAETKTVLGDDYIEDGKVKTTAKWSGEELITIHDGKNGFTFYTNATEASTSAEFTYEGYDFTASEVMAVYPSGEYTADVKEKTVFGVNIPSEQLLVAGTYPATAAAAIAYSDNNVLSFKNATALLKFKVSGDDVKFGSFYGKEIEDKVSGVFAVDCKDGSPKVSATAGVHYVNFRLDNNDVLSKDDTYYVAIAPGTVTNFSVSLNGNAVKTLPGSFTFERNVIYDLKTIQYTKPAVPSFDREEGYIYLMPSTNWKEAGARFAAYFFGNGEIWKDMTEVPNTEGSIYACEIPDGFSSVIFCRMNPSTDDNNWENKWTQTGDLNLGDGNLYIVDGWDEGEWDGDPAVTPNPTPEPEPAFEPKAGHLYLTPNSNWKQAGARFAAYFFEAGETWVSMTAVDGETDLYEVEIPSGGYTKVIFCRMNPSANENNWSNKWNQTGDLTIPTNANVHFTVPSGEWDGATDGWSAFN